MIKDLLLVLAIFAGFYLVFENIYLKKELTKQKESFIQILGHDFRVAVIAILRGVDLLLKSADLSDDKKELVKEINNGAVCTLDMVTMLMQIYKLENKTIPLKYEQFDLPAAISNILSELNYKTIEKNINLSLSTEIMFINADKELLIKALIFLITTVIDYSKCGAQIGITVKKQNKGFILDISYDGNPISYDDYLRMFKNNSRYSTVGHGIQMNFCKKIIKLHKGKIGFTSKADKTHVFSISIPQMALAKR